MHGLGMYGHIYLELANPLSDLVSGGCLEKIFSFFNEHETIIKKKVNFLNKNILCHFYQHIVTKQTAQRERLVWFLFSCYTGLWKTDPMHPFHTVSKSCFFLNI